MKGGSFTIQNVVDNVADEQDSTKTNLVYRDVEVLTANLDDETLA